MMLIISTTSFSQEIEKEQKEQQIEVLIEIECLDETIVSDYDLEEFMRVYDMMVTLMFFKYYHKTINYT